MTPKQIVAAVSLVNERRRVEFAIQANAVLIGAQGDPKKVDKFLQRELKK